MAMVLYESELLHTRTGRDVVDVEIAAFDWANWWNGARLHQGLVYRTRTDIESELWKNSDAQELMENKANA